MLPGSRKKKRPPENNPDKCAQKILAGGRCTPASEDFYISSPETLREETDILPALRSQNFTSFMIFSKAPALFLT